MKLTLSALGLLAFVAFAPLAAAKTAAAAEAPKFTFDKAHTQIFFSVSHLGFSYSTGKFTGFDGSFTFDEAKPESSKIDVTIDTNSLTMDDEAWEKHLKNEDFFNVEKFPAMTFKSTQIEKTGDNTGRVTGDLTLLGVTKPVTLDVIFNKGGIHPYSKKYVAGFSVTGKLNRSDFGMTYGLPGVGDEVNISIEVEGIREEPAAPQE